MIGGLSRPVLASSDGFVWLRKLFLLQNQFRLVLMEAAVPSLHGDFQTFSELIKSSLPPVLIWPVLTVTADFLANSERPVDH